MISSSSGVDRSEFCSSESLLRLREVGPTGRATKEHHGQATLEARLLRLEQSSHPLSWQSLYRKHRSNIAQPDMDGNALQTLHDPDSEIQELLFGVVATADGGAVVFQLASL